MLNETGAGAHVPRRAPALKQGVRQRKETGTRHRVPQETSDATRRRPGEPRPCSAAFRRLRAPRARAEPPPPTLAAPQHPRAAALAPEAAGPAFHAAPSRRARGAPTDPLNLPESAAGGAAPAAAILPRPRKRRAAGGLSGLLLFVLLTVLRDAMRLKLLGLLTRSSCVLAEVYRCQSFNKIGCLLSKTSNEVNRTIHRTADEIGNLYALKTDTPCLTSQCVQVKNWQLLQGNVSALGKKLHYQSGGTFFPPWKCIGAAVMENYKLNPVHVKNLKNISVRCYSVVSTGKIIAKPSIQPVKRPPKAPRTKQPSRTNQPLSDTQD
ncbi:uncharacterized protein ACNFOS_001198 [Eudromia elegans]